MSLLTLATPENATGEVKKIFDEIQSMFGMVPNGIRQWSANPQALRVQWESIKVRLSKDKEDQKLHAMIRYLVSDESHCVYCTGFNGAMLINMYGLSQDELIDLQKNPAAAVLSEKNKSLLLFALKSIKNPDAVNEEDINHLKELGISEIEMFDIVHVASHMLVVNTLFKTFKVEKD